MGLDPPVAVYDACVLYPFQTRNLLMHCAADALVRARWTDAINDELIRNVPRPLRRFPPFGSIGSAT
jgi:hypothetical protein